MISVVSLVLLLAAAPSDSVKLVTTLEPSSVTIGDRVRLTLEVTHPEDFIVMAPDFVDGHGPLQLLASQPPEVVKEGDITTTTRSYLFQVVGLDFANAPAFDVLVQKNEDIRTLKAPPMLLRIESVLPSADAEPRDIKPPLSLPRAYPFYLAAGLALLLLALIAAAIVLRRRRRHVTTRVEILRPAHEIAFEELQALKERGTMESSDFMEYFVELSRILREYIGRRYAFDAMEKTTTELGKELSETDMPSEPSVESLRVLSESDLVKFARHKAESARRQKLYSSVWGVVETTMEIAEEPDDPVEEEMSSA